jgi:hypothetical protein
VQVLAGDTECPKNHATALDQAKGETYDDQDVPKSEIHHKVREDQDEYERHPSDPRTLLRPPPPTPAHTLPEVTWPETTGCGYHPSIFEENLTEV